MAKLRETWDACHDARPNQADVPPSELLIDKTQFFRDQSTFLALEVKVITEIVASGDISQPVRVWVTACATGEEAYSIAILLFERMAAIGCHRAIQIFATDVDARAITVARAGRYPASIASFVSKQRLNAFFINDGDSYCVTKTLREVCLFSTQDLVRDPPFARIDLVSCRNLLSGLQRPLQDHLFTLIHYALRPKGYLFLGQSETVPSQSQHFRAIDKQHRLFVRRDTPARFPAFLLSSLRLRPSMAAANQTTHFTDMLDRQAARQLARYAPAFVIVDPLNDIIRTSGQTARYLAPNPDVPTQQLFTLLNADLRHAARQALLATRNTRRRSIARSTDWRTADRGGSVSVIVEELLVSDAAGLCLMAFVNVPALSEASRAFEAHTADVAIGDQDADGVTLPSLEQLLQATRERLHASTEELGIVTAELQASNEEYLTVNEELRSANEELEASKEELQSLNVELQTANVELSHRNDSLIRSNSDLANLFDSTAIATLFLDDTMAIRRFTPGIVDIFNVRDGDEGRLISDITFKLTNRDILTDIRKVLQRQDRVEREVVSVGGATYLMQIRPYRDLNDTISGAVVSFIDISERKLHEQARAHLAAIVVSSQDGIISQDLDGKITSWNAGAQSLFGYTVGDAIGADLTELIRIPESENWRGKLESVEQSAPIARFDSRAVSKDSLEVEISITISPLRDMSGQIVGASLVVRDISARIAADRKTLLLLGELDHRVKNILAIVSAVISQTLSSGLAPKAFAIEVEGRIQAVAKAHSLLTHAGNGTMSVRDVILTELAPYKATEAAGRLSVTGTDVDLTPKAGMAIAMAIHELTSNSAKYGALSTSAGHLSVEVSTLSGPVATIMNLIWTEANGPKVVAPTRRGFGTSLIERALAYELDAKVTRRFDPAGVVCVFEIPLTDEVGYVQHSR